MDGPAVMADPWAAVVDGNGCSTQNDRTARGGFERFAGVELELQGDADFSERIWTVGTKRES